MSNQQNSPLLETEVLLRELLNEVRKMKANMSELKLENERLRSQLRSVDVGSSDGLVGNGSAERIALRQQIRVLIEKIDRHLPGESR